MQPISPLESFHTFDRIGVTQVHVARQCLLKGMFAMSRAENLIPRHPAAIEGTLRHRESQLEETGHSGAMAVHHAAREMRERLTGTWDERWISMLPPADEVPPQVIAAAPAVAPASDVEVPVRGGPDDVIVGSVDRVRREEAGVTIVDLKTGQVRDPNGQVKPEYVEQLQLYSAIWPDNHDEPVVALALQVLGSPNEVTVSLPDDGAALIDEAVARLRAAQGAAANPRDAAAPAPESCRWCLFRPRCPAYLEGARSRSGPPVGARPNIADPQRWPVDLFGTVTDIHIFGDQGVSDERTFGLTLRSGDIEFRIRGLTPVMLQITAGETEQQVRDVLVGHEVGVFEAAWDVPGSDTWRAGEQTVVHEL